MPHYQNVRREPDDLVELNNALAEATTAAATALRAAGGNEDDRQYKNAEFLRLRAERQLAAAQHRADKKARLLSLSPTEIVDKAMER